MLADALDGFIAVLMDDCDAETLELALKDVGNLPVEIGEQLLAVSTRVTSTPSAAKMPVYSMPMTPAPSTIIAFGILLSSRIVSLSTTHSSSKAHQEGGSARS